MTVSYPKVSIITPAFNSEKYILKCYDSIKEQTLDDWEWIVIDDGSLDRTRDIIGEISSVDERVKFIKNATNSGAAISRNKGIDIAKGKYIAFIDSDDLWHCEKLERQYNFMQKDKIDFSFTAYEVINELGTETLYTVDKTAPSEVGYESHLKKGATLGCSTVMLKRSSIGDMRMPDLRSGQDYAFWLMILKSGTSAFCLNKVLTSYRITPGSISRNKLKKAKRQWQIYRELEKLSLAYSTKCFFYYAYRAVFRRR